MRANNANKRLGQYFLVNLSVLRKIVASLEVAPGDTVIEIGPGHGELTGELLALRFELLGKDVENARIVVIEKDQRLAEKLAQKFHEQKGFEILTGDALKLLPEILSTSKLKATSYKLVGNIPYYITGHLLRIVGELERKPKQCVFTLQKEVAERICAKPPRANRLSVSVQYWAEPKILAVVPREDFRPVPKVDSAILLLETRPPDRQAGTSAPSGGGSASGGDEYYRAVRALFAQPRKTVLNNIVANGEWRMANGKTGGKADAMRILEEAGVDPSARPQDLSVEQIIALSKTDKGLNQSV